MLRKVYAYEQLNGQSAAAVNQHAANNGTINPPATNQSYAIESNKPADVNPFGTVGGNYSTVDSYQNAAQPNQAFDPLNPQW